ncbi:hypothetical protein EJ110_NYTH53733 [Nymphaea thermarum]|nr:hypothetical protein EJ110_NYTH53733 [Nymphaea thermarum]
MWSKVDLLIVKAVSALFLSWMVDNIVTAFLCRGFAVEVEEELLNLQQDDQSLAQYFASLKSTYERLKALRSPCPTCHKTQCEQSIVAKFLQGLSPEYALAKAQMLTGAEIPNLSEAYN